MHTWKTRPAPAANDTTPAPPRRHRLVVSLLPVEIDAALDVALGDELGTAGEALGLKAPR